VLREFKFARLLPALVLAACAEREPPPAPVATNPAPAAQRAVAVDYRAALAAPGRTPADIEQDSWRKPAEVLEFFGVQPGMSALDLFAGAGYFTPLLSAVVGPTGRVVAHNNKAYLDGVGEGFARLFEGPQALANAERLTAEGNELFAAMKPGATLGLIDHAAAPGSPHETGGTLHRIDPEIVKRDFAASGFVLDAESGVLRNPGDDHTKGVFDPAVRRRTDRFVLRFRRP
jgi:predicted methyltransferase